MKSIRFEMVLVHEAFQYLLRRKAMQVITQVILILEPAPTRIFNLFPANI